MPTSRFAPLTALLWMSLCLTAPARAATLNVPTTAYPTIQAAINASQNGDTVLVADGTYSGPGNVDLSFAGRKIMVTSRNGAGATVIDCGGQSAGSHRAFAFQPGDTDATVSGLTIQNGYEDAGGGILVNSGSSVTVLNCVFVQNSAISPGYPQGGGVYNTGFVSMTNCTFSQNLAEGGYGGLGAGFANNGTAMVADCTFSQNTADGGSGGGVFNNSSGSIIVTNCTLMQNNAKLGGGLANDGAVVVTNCTFTQNVAALYGGGLFSDFGTGTITNNIFFNDTGNSLNEIGYAGGPENSVTPTYCDVQGGYTGTGNINTDPLFVYATGGSLHLRPGSPCLGAGTGSGAPTTDKDGVTRPSPPSIGAYEATPSHTHLLWNNSDGRVVLWRVAADGTFTLSGFGPYTDDYVSSDPNNKWHATALAAAPDGTSRLVWNNVDHRVMLWSLDASGNVLSVTGYGPYTDTFVNSSPGNLWSAVGVSVGPDGLTHLLWSNTDRRMMFWDLDAQGNLLGLSGYGPYTDDSVSSSPANVWSAAALATGPDNVSRVVWNNVDHRVMLWTLNGPGGSAVAGIAGYGPYTDNAPQNLWSAVGVSVGPDNVTHLLWSNTDRRAMFWDVNPDFSFTLAGYGPYTDDAPQNLWSASAVATGPDGLSHVLWNNTDDRAMLWGVDNSFRFAVAGYGPYTDNAPGNLWGVTAVSAGP